MTPERARLFVAADLPAAVRAQLAGWAAAQTGGVAGLRLIDAASLHVTLCFLGWGELGEVPAIAAACRAAVPSVAVPLRVGAPLWLPPRRPRVLAVDLDDETAGLARAQSALAAALSAGGHYEPEDRAFLAHVTVARVRRGARIRPTELPAPEPVSFPVPGVTLYRSHLGSGGARYVPLETVPLPGA